MPRSDSKLEIIAIELGAPWPAWLEQSAPASRRVLSELEGETPAVFAARVAEELAREHLTPVSAVLSCNGRSDAAQLEARRTLALSLIGERKAVPLTLVLPAAANARLERALSTLVNELGRRAVLRSEEEAPAVATTSRVASVA